MEFAQKAGCTADPEFIFRERGSTSGPERTELARLLQSARDGQVNAILVHHYDRLSRDPLQLARVLSELRRLGVRLVTTDRPQPKNQGGLRDRGQSRWRFWRWRKERKEIRLRKRSAIRLAAILSGDCGASVCGNGGDSKHRYYRCNQSYAKENKPKLCDDGGINVDRLNGDVWDCVVASLQCPDGTIADWLSNVGTGGGDVGDEKRRVEAELKRLDAEEVEIAALDVQRVYRREVLHGRMAKLNLRRDELQLKLKELNEQERLVEEASEIEGRIRAYCERLREGLDELDFNGKRQVLAALGVRAYAIKEEWWMTGVTDPGFLVDEPTSTCRR